MAEWVETEVGDLRLGDQVRVGDPPCESCTGEVTHIGGTWVRIHDLRLFSSSNVRFFRRQEVKMESSTDMMFSGRRLVDRDAAVDLTTNVDYCGDGVIEVTTQYRDDYESRSTKYFRLTEVEREWKEVK